MVTVGIRELRDHLSEYLRRVRDGEELTITKRSEPVARILPAVNQKDVDPGILDMIDDGQVSWGGGIPSGLSDAPEVDGGSVSDIVLEERE